MAATFNNLTAGGVNNTTSFSTPGIVPIANRLILVSLTSQVSSGSPNVPSVSLPGWTFSQVTTVTPFGGSGGVTQRISLFVGIGSGTGPVTISFGGQTQQIAQYIVDQVAYTVITGSGGSNAIVQIGTYTAPAAGFTITLSAFASSNNATYACTAKNALNTVSPTTGMTILSQVNDSSPNFALATMGQSSPNTNPAAVFAGSGGDNVGAIAVEISFLSQNAFIGKYF